MKAEQPPYMKTERNCPDCLNCFSAVADLCICPKCNRRFYASDPNRPLVFRMPPRLTFDASFASAHEENGILNICFDDGGDGYVHLSRVSDDCLHEYDDLGGVSIEVNSQLVACTDGYAKIELAPNVLSIQFRDESVMKGLIDLVVL
jgi:hypothetical protein